MDINIRKCILDDCEQIVLLNKNEMGYDFSFDNTKQRMEKVLNDKNHKINVAVIDNKVVGYVHANNYDLLYAPHYKNILGIAVNSDYKRMGIGKLLLESIEKWAEQTGAVGVRLVSGGTRLGAHDFYRVCGYSGEKQQINFKKFIKEF